MSNYIFDTHAFIWFMNGDKTLPVSTRNVMNEAINDANAYVSAITPWEISMLAVKERIKLAKPTSDWLNTAFQETNIQLIPLSIEASVESCQLPGNFHPDPADRFIVASARLHDMTIITRDQRILEYSAEHYVKALKC